MKIQINEIIRNQKVTYLQKLFYNLTTKVTTLRET